MSYNAEKMWDGPRPPFGAFRGHTGEPYPSRWPHGFEPRMRGRSPVPYQGGAMAPGPSYSSQGGHPFSYRDAGRGQEGTWEESMPAPKDQMNNARRGAAPANFRDVADMRYSEQGLTPDMDYREREVLEQRKWTTPDVDYRGEEGPSVSYRVRLPPPSRRMIGGREIQEREALELDYRKRLAAALDYRQREAIEMEYKLQMEVLLKRREREELLIREREYTERLLWEREALERMRDRDAMVLGLRGRDSGASALSDREAGSLALRDRDAAASFQERQVTDYTERGQPRVRESVDLDLRVRESDNSMDFIGRDRGMEYQENLPREYSESGTVSMPYREKEKSNLEYMEAEQQDNDSLKAGTLKDAAGFTPSDKKSAEMPYRQAETSCVNFNKGEVQRPEFQKHTDADYREKECADSDYRGKESTDSDYRARGTKTADADYREKESTYSEYRKQESADTDYRQSAEDYKKESADKMGTERDFLPSSLKKGSKGLTTEYPLIPTKIEEKTGPKQVEIIPFLSFSEDELSSLTNMMVEAQSKPPAEVQAKSNSESNCPGKMDTDFRDRPNPDDVNIGAKERAEKAVAYPAHSAPEKLCSGDQDLRSKDSFAKDSKKEGDQDLRGQIQKDEDLRGGETKTPEEFFAQNSLLMDFLRLAAKELREKTSSVSESKDEPSTLPPAPPDPVAAKTFPPDLIARPARPVAPGSSITPQIEFLCREDIDYRNMDFNDVDLRVSHRPDKRLAEKRPREEPQPGSKDKDYRRTPLPEGATKIIWLDGLPTGASREEILCALGSVHSLPEDGVNLIGYIPGYSLGSVCVEFSLVEEAVGCMEANKGVLHFRGKKVTLKYIPNSDRWLCLQCKAVNVLSKERCWQCSALRAGTDHLSLRDSHKEPKTQPTTSTSRSKKRKSKRSPSAHSPDHWKEKTPPRERSPPPKTSKVAKQTETDSATVIIRGISVNTSVESVVKALQPYAQLSPSNVRIMKTRKSNQRGFGFIDLKNHKEAIRLTVLVRDLKPPLTIDGKTISVDLAVGQRRNEQGKSSKGNKSSPGKNRKQRGQRKSFSYPGFRAEEGPSYIYDPKTGCYVDPLTDSTYSEHKNEKRDDYTYRDSERDTKEAPSRSRRGFTEENEADEDAFKKPLPPLVMKKEEPAEPKVNPLLGLIGAYVEDSEEEEEEEEQQVEEMLPPLPKKPAPPPPIPATKPVPKPAVVAAAKPAPKPEPKPATVAPSSSEYNKMIDWKKLLCLLCRRQFPSKEALTRHKNLSDLHKQNIALHEKIKKSQKELEYLQQREHEENQCIQRRLQQAKKELEMLEREEEGARQQEAGEGLYTDVHTAEKRKAKGADAKSELSSDKKRLKPSANQKPAGESYRENMKRLILERYKELE